MVAQHRARDAAHVGSSIARADVVEAMQAREWEV
jgi:hypothetical protein